LSPLLGIDDSEHTSDCLSKIMATLSYVSFDLGAAMTDKKMLSSSHPIQFGSRRSYLLNPELTQFRFELPKLFHQVVLVLPP
jgi:hypothetical protein